MGVCVSVFVCVFFWTPVSMPCPKYEVVGLQHQAVDIPKPMLCESPTVHFKAPLRLICMPDTRQTKDRQWVNLWPPLWAIRLPQ